jgi:excisionase family DNA binding protein
MSSPPDGSTPVLPRLYDLRQVSEALQLSMSHLRREIRLRRIEVVRLGRTIRVSAEAIEAYLAKRSRSAR